MANPDSIALAASAEAEGLESVLVGGNAVNLHAYLRTTFHVDLLVRESESERWLSFFEQHGYTVFHRTRNFTRLRFAHDPAAALPVDLMLADTLTFARIRGESRRCDIGKGLNLLIPSPLHLIAMKLHALRSPQRFETGVDLQDVKHLIKAAKIDTSGSEFAEIVKRHVTDTIRARILDELSEKSDSWRCGDARLARIRLPSSDGRSQ